MKNDDISWNFEKVLVDHMGQPVRRYVPHVDPIDVVEDIEELIRECEDEMKDKRDLEDPRKRNLF